MKAGYGSNRRTSSPFPSQFFVVLSGVFRANADSKKNRLILHDVFCAIGLNGGRSRRVQKPAPRNWWEFGWGGPGGHGSRLRGGAGAACGCSRGGFPALPGEDLLGHGVTLKGVKGVRATTDGKVLW